VIQSCARALAGLSRLNSTMRSLPTAATSAWQQAVASSRQPTLRAQARLLPRPLVPGPAQQRRCQGDDASSHAILHANVGGKVRQHSTGMLVSGTSRHASPICELPPKGSEANWVRRVASTTIPTSFGPLPMVAFQSHMGDILAVVNGIGDGHSVPVRVHDACLTGEVFGSLKCDCGQQLQMALTMQVKTKLGVVIYMPQEGRGIGLANKIAAYYMQEEHGMDTVDANLALGLPAEMRDYSVLGRVMEELGVGSVLLMTNNPFKVKELRAAGVLVAGTLPLVVAPVAASTQKYLETKRKRMQHDLPPASLAPGACPAALEGPAWDLLCSLRSEIEAHSRSAGPFTVLSFATSLDGFIADSRTTPGGEQEQCPVALSGEESMTLTHHLRGAVDAILVGVGTVLADDPLLSVRREGAGPSPQPIVLDSHLRLPPEARLLRAAVPGGRAPTVVLCVRPEDGGDAEREARAAALRSAGAVLVECSAEEGTGRVCFEDAWRQLEQLGMRSLMVEGGAEVIAALLRKRDTKLVDRLVVTQASAILGRGVSWASQSRPSLLEAHGFALGRDMILAAKF